MYRVISAFNDLLDSNHLYKVGDEYPREGCSATDARIKELASSENKQRKPLIEAVDVESVTETTAAKPSRKRRGKKNEND